MTDIEQTEAEVRIFKQAHADVCFIFNGKMVATFGGATPVRPFVPAGQLLMNNNTLSLYILPCGPEAQSCVHSRCSPAWMVKPMKTSELKEPNMVAVTEEFTIDSDFALPHGAKATLVLTGLAPNPRVFDLFPKAEEDDNEVQEEAAQVDGPEPKKMKLITPKVDKFVALTRAFFDNEEPIKNTTTPKKHADDKETGLSYKQMHQ